MVNFDDSQTISTPAYEVEKITILQRRYDLLEALEYYEKLYFQSGTNSNAQAVLRARMRTLFRQLKPVLKRKYKKEEYQEFIKKVNSKSEEDISWCIDELLDFIDRIKITRIDNAKEIDSADIEEVNKSKGYS